jgi:hypothetical protein
VNVKALLLILAAAFFSSGCISQQTLGQLDGLVKPEHILERPEITGLISRGVQVGQVLTGALTVILCFVCWYRATHGNPFVGIAKEWFVWTALALYILTTVGNGTLGPVMWIYESGGYLGRLFAPPQGYWSMNHDLAVGRMAQFLDAAQRALPGSPPPPGSQEAAAFFEGFLYMVLNPISVVGIVLNGIAIHVFKLVLQVSYTFLLVFYWTLTPMIAPMLVLPQTRHVFLGWVKSYISVALWPFFFAIAEQLAIAIPWTTWLGIENLIVGSGNAASVVDWTQGQVMLLVLNLAFLAVYASIPVISNRIVTGASQPFRAGVL